MAVFRSRGTMPVVRCVDDVRDGRQEDVKVFIKKRGGNGIEFTRLAGALSIIFKTNSTVLGRLAACVKDGTLTSRAITLAHPKRFFRNRL